MPLLTTPSVTNPPDEVPKVFLRGATFGSSSYLSKFGSSANTTGSSYLGGEEGGATKSKSEVEAVRVQEERKAKEAKDAQLTDEEKVGGFGLGLRFFLSFTKRRLQWLGGV